MTLAFHDHRIAACRDFNWEDCDLNHYYRFPTRMGNQGTSRGNPPQTMSICLELIPQGKLHDARLRQQARIRSEIVL